MKTENPYKVLGVHPEADDTVVEAAYDSLVKKHHPDQGGNENKFKKIQSAYQQITQGSGDESSVNSDVDGGDIFSLFDTPIATEKVTGNVTDDLVIEGDQLTVCLINIQNQDISEYINYDIPTYNDSSDTNRLIVILHVKNHSDYVQKFKPTELRIIGQDERRYDAEYAGMVTGEVSDDLNSLPPHLYDGSREMEPHTKANFISTIEDMPDSVQIDRVIYPFKLFEGHQIDGIVQEKTRYVFDIEPKHWEQFELVSKGKMESIPELTNSDKSQQSGGSKGGEKKDSMGKNGSSGSKTGTTTTENEALSELDFERIKDIVEKQPTTNSELEELWGLSGGSEVYQYLSGNINDFYERNDDKKIVATKSAETLVTQDNE
jgi:hypothetical protein